MFAAMMIACDVLAGNVKRLSTGILLLRLERPELDLRHER